MQNGNEYQFVLSNPKYVFCCDVATFEITQSGNSTMTAHINFQNMVSYNWYYDPNPDPYPVGKFYKNWVNLDVLTPIGETMYEVTSKDLHFKVNTQFKDWVTQ